MFCYPSQNNLTALLVTMTELCGFIRLIHEKANFFYEKVYKSAYYRAFKSSNLYINSNYSLII